MTAAAGLILGFFLSTAYGAGFHLIFGGPTRRILLYIIAAWLGFLLGHFIGDLLNIELLKLGVLHLFSASLGAWIALLVSWWIVKREET